MTDLTEIALILLHSRMHITAFAIFRRRVRHPVGAGFGSMRSFLVVRAAVKSVIGL
ncbi:hypothetical protein [Streptomyces nojiriensis]|uniref:hypothetical protein n=1 Tax=Streptomyces nojiriensis TaxID=66374 RepID=UPI00365FF5AE